MIREVAQFQVKAGTERDFIAAVERAIPIFRAAKGCVSFKLEQVVEIPSHFRLNILWETLEDHTVGFRESEGFTQWRGLVGEYFAAVPQVDHSAVVVDGF